MIGPVQASDLLPDDALPTHDWAGVHALHIASAVEGDWSDSRGRHHGMVVITRELGPQYALHYALAEVVTVERAL